MKPHSKPLFIPLKTGPYEKFKAGLKTHEIRLNGGRWNRQTCFPGRGVVLSKGYGKQERLSGRIISVNVFTASRLSEEEYADFIACYGDGPNARTVIYIGIKLDA